jgi:hypothetical protein
MSSRECAICGPKRTSRALCNCCGQYLCRDHLKEHDDLLNAQLEPIADNINQLAHRLQQFDIDSLLLPTRIQLDEWRQSAVQSIERIYEQKSLQLNELLSKQLDQLRERTKQIQTEVLQLIREQDATNDQIDLLVTTIENIEKETNEIQHKPITIDIRPLIIDDIYINFPTKKESDDSEKLMLTPPIERLLSSPANANCIASNNTHILLHRHPTLCLYDHNLNLIKQTHPYSDWNIADMCYSSTLNHFIILTDDDVFFLDETKMILEKSTIPTRNNGHWHSITCSFKSLFLTAYKWGSNIYEYNIDSSSIELKQRWQTPLTCTKDESIDHFVHNNNDHISMIIQNRIDQNKSFQLRFDKTLECIWSLKLNQCHMTIHRNTFCSIRQNEWLIIDSNQSRLLYISQDGLLKQIIDYEFYQLRDALQITSHFLLVTTDRSVNLHQLL